MSYSSQIASYQASINANHRSIDTLRTRITELNQKITNVQIIRLRIMRRQADFVQAMQQEQGVLSAIKASVHSKAAAGYAEKMFDYFEGTTHNNAGSVFDDAILELERVMQEYAEEIEGCRMQTRSLEDSITSLSSSISRLRAMM
jgi:TolA-binding protein